MKTLIKKINRILKDRGTRRLLTRIVSVSAALVVFVTTYALVLPAITMETEAQCGIEAHQHSDSCYEDVLVCGLEESEGHTHDDSCYSISHELTCEIPEHQHDKNCYDEDGNLQCKLSEHDHTDNCYKEVRELTCTLEESEGHHHTDACYEKNLICGKEVHTHSSACYEKTEAAAVAASEGYTAGVAYEVNDDDAADDFGSSDTDGLEVTDDAGYTDGLEAAGESDDADALEETDGPDGADALEETDSPGDTDAPEWTDHNDAPEDAVTFEETGDPGDTDASEQTDDPGEPGALEVTSHDAIWEDADNAGTSEAADYSDSSEEAGSADPSQKTDNAGLSDWDPPLQEESEAAPTTNVLPEGLENEELSDGYVPQLDSLIFDSVLNDYTAFYYFHPEEGEEVPANSVDIASWKPVDENTELAPTDLVKAYLAYTIPAGSLNETNQVARYRLPSNLHLTEEQILAINSHENGIAAGYIDPETNTVPDEDAANYSEYLGAEAVEGTRRPDQAPGDGSVDGEQEYISATVKAENVFDEEGLYGEKGAYLGQDLIFVFSPYTIQKNQTTYDKDGKPTARGEKVTGWFAVDFNMDQIDWSEPVETILPADSEGQSAIAEAMKQEQESVQEQNQTETDAKIQSQENTGKTTYTALQRIERIANIVFAAEGKDENDHKIHEISAELKLVQENEIEIENEDQPVTDAEEQAENPESDKEKEPSDEKSETDQTDNSDSAKRTNSAEDGATADADSAIAENKEGETEKAAPEYKDGTFEANGSGYRITMDYKADAQIPENAYLHVTEITRESDAEAYEACLEEARKSVPSDGTRVDDKASRFFDIEILVDEPAFEENGDEDLHENEQKNTATENENAESDETQIRTRKIEPAAPVSVNIQLFDTEISQKPDEFNAEQYKVVHIAEDKTEEIQDVKAQTIEPEKKDVSSASTEKESDSDTTAVAPATEVQFEAESFSIYGVVYTVDFHWEVDGKEYEFNLPGGGFVSFEALVELMDVANKDTKDDPESITGENPADSSVETISAKGKLTLNGITVSEKTKAFVRDVADVVFSNPELVWVGKTEEHTTVGSLKTANQLKVQYSADLTEEQIAEIDAQTVEPEDWALISLLPFESDENLTVTMKDGERFVIHVTDEQIATNVLTADGETYKITVTFTEEAKIPAGTKLVAEEIEPGSEEYLRLLGHTWLEVNKEYLEQQERIYRNDPSNETAEIRPVNIDEVRFFDITFICNGEELEPKAPVQVDIQLVKGLSNSADVPVTGVVHFPSEKTDENAQEAVPSDSEDPDGEKPNEEQIELIEKIETVEDKDGAFVEFSYEQGSFSKVGVYLGQPTYEAGMESMDPADALPKLTAMRAGEEQESLEPFEASKELTPNINEETNQPDGTYTLSFSVKGDEITSQQITKANVLIMMDRSTSMNNGTSGTAVPYDGDYEEGVTYYGIGGDKKLWPLNHTSNGWQILMMGEDPAEYTGQVYKASNRLQAEQAALDELVSTLVSKNTQANPDTIEVCIRSFGSQRGSELTGKTDTSSGGVWVAGTETGWCTTYGENTELYNAIANNSKNNGTNWEDALIYAKELADAKKELQPDEDVYIIFLTDGEPTAVYGEKANSDGYGAHHYENSYTTIDGGSAVGLSYAKYDNRPNSYNSNTDPGNNIANYNTVGNYGKAWNVQDIVTAGYKFYSIFTFNDSEKYSQYLKHLVNYAYGNDSFNDDPEATQDTPASDAFYTNATDIASLRESFDNIFTNIFDKLAYGDVKIVDGLSTDAMTTVPVNGQTDGIKYSVKDENGNLVYTVTATGPIGNPTDVIFKAGNTEYKLSENKVQKVTITRNRTELVDGVPQEREYTGSYYVVKEPGIEYRMALADLVSVGEGTDETRTLTWDLSPIGSLKKDYTYTAEMIVWPNQEAYDYVAGLNNGLDGFVWVDPVIDEATGEVITPGGAGPVYNEEGTFLYYKFPSIVKDENGVFSVRTNTEQNVYYSEVHAQGSNDIVTSETDTPHVEPLDFPDPMPLTVTNTYLEKEWSVDRNPARLAQYLYNMDGTSKEFVAAFDVFPGDSDVPYTTVYLGWDDDKEEYVWAEDSPIKNVTYGGYTHQIGTRWAQEFSIATGLMLSTELMDAHDLDKNAYRSTTYTNDEGTTITYYILEPGHEYRIEEQEGLGYEFDFISPVFHPMLVDGVLQNVTFDGYHEDADPDEDPFDNPFSITSITDAPGGIGSLLVKNTLRGYIDIEKKVVDKDGVTALVDDDTKFTYTIELHNDTNPGPFVDEDIPWYGINGLFYHEFDEETHTYTYYQAEVTNTETNQSHTLELTTESGEVYEAWCTDENGKEYEGDDETALYIFDEDIIGPSYVTYNDGTQDVTIRLFGNQMTHMGGEADTNNVSAEFQITQSEILNLANIPSGTTYSIVEAPQDGYSFVSVRKEIRNGDTVESRTTVTTGNGAISGTIVPDRDSHFIYTNKIYSKDITVKKVDNDGNVLTGAVFTLTRTSGSGESEYDAGVSKPGDGESDLGSYTFFGLADGTYSLTETTPPEGYTGISSPITFTVTGGVVSGTSGLPTGVTWDGESATFTVKNQETNTGITVRKQWLDAGGNPKTYDGTLDLTLKQWAENVATNYNVTINFQYLTNGGWGQTNTNTFTTRTGTGTGRATISWQYSWGVDRSSVTVSGLNSGEYSISPGSGSNSEYTLTINNVNRNMTINIGYNYNANANPYTNVGDISITQASSEGFTIVDTKTITLGENGDWSKHYTVSGSGSMTDTTLPATYQGRNCYYTIEEPSVPGYIIDTTRSSDLDTPVQSGVIAVYNKATESGSLGVNKLVEASNSALAGGHVHLANGKYNFTVSRVTSEDPYTTQIVKYVQIRINDGRATYKVSGNEIPYTAPDSGFRWVYAEGAIVDDLIPGTYVVEETAYQLDNPAGYTMELKEIEVGGSGPNSTDLEGKKAVLTVTADSVVTATSSFTNLLVPEIDVPVLKGWNWSEEDEGNVESWSATFNLEYREVLVSGEGDPNANIHWTPVYEADGETQKSIVITSTSQNPKFEDLPMYKVHEDEDGNISVYRIIYAVDEVAYTVNLQGGGTKTWNKNDSGHFEQHYSPTYEQDAGELDQPKDLDDWADWYTVKVTNTESTKEIRKTIDLSLEKTWENEPDKDLSTDPDTYAKFRLMRYYHEESLDLTANNLDDPDTSPLVTAKLVQDDNTVSELIVPKGAPVYIAGVVKAGESVDVSFSNGNRTVSLNGGSGTSTRQQYIVSNNYYTADEGLVINLVGGETDPLVGGIYGLRLASFDTGDITDYQVDTAFNNQAAGKEFTLSAEDGWTKDWVDLPQVVEEKTVNGDHIVLKTIVYSYYLVETDCHPDKYAAVFQDGLGNSRNPLIFSTPVAVENKVETTIVIWKIDEMTRSDDSQTTLAGAYFRLLKYTGGTGGSYVGYDDYGVEGGVPVGSDGTLMFENLPNGEYQIVETVPPPGYIKIENNNIYINVTNGVVTRYDKPANNSSRQPIPATVPVSDDPETFEPNVVAGVSYVPNDDHAEATFTVGNTPGAELPNSGGPGTALFTILGSILILGAGVLLWRRRRLI